MSAECQTDSAAMMASDRPPLIADAAHVVVPRHLRTDETVAVGWHTHAEGLLFAVVQGLATMQTEGGTWTMLPRQIGWLPPATRHCGHSFGRTEAFFFYLRPDVCRAMPDRPRVLHMSALSHALIERLDEFAGSLPLPRVERMLQVLIDEIREASEVPLHLPLPRDQRLLRLTGALNAAPDDDTSLDGWAAALGIGRRTMIRRFTQETGLSIGQWRQQLRLVKALELLADGQSVTTAALSVGYSSVSAFISCFRQRFGVTPSKYFNRDAVR
jgi:AraC-like DNA-binding protein